MINMTFSVLMRDAARGSLYVVPFRVDLTPSIT